MCIKYLLYTALREHRGQLSIINGQTNSFFFEEPFKFHSVLGASQSPARSLIMTKIQIYTEQTFHLKIGLILKKSAFLLFSKKLTPNMLFYADTVFHNEIKNPAPSDKVSIKFFAIMKIL